MSLSKSLVQGYGRRESMTPTVGGKPLRPGTRRGCSTLPTARADPPSCAATGADRPTSEGRSWRSGTGCASRDGGMWWCCTKTDLLPTDLMPLLWLGLRWSPIPGVSAGTPHPQIQPPEDANGQSGSSGHQDTW